MKKILSSVISSILGAAIVMAVAVGSSWFVNWNVKTWFNSWGKSKTSVDNSGNEQGDSYTENLIVTSISENGIMPLSIMTYSTENDYYSDIVQGATKITATVSPIATEARDFTWLAEWSDPSSEWASGKNVFDYLVFTSTTWSADARTSAYVEVIQPFGEQIIITCSYDNDPTICASCTADYLKRVENAAVYADIVMNGEVTLHSLEALYTVGTIKGTITPKYLYAELSAEAKAYLTPWARGSSSYIDTWSDLSNGDSSILQLGVYGYRGEGKKDLTQPDCDYRFDVNYFVCDSSDNYFVNQYLQANADTYLQAAFIDCARTTSNNLRAVVEYTYSYGDISFDGIAYSEYVSMSPDWFYSDLFAVNGLGVDKDTILFY